VVLDDSALAWYRGAGVVLAGLATCTLGVKAAGVWDALVVLDDPALAWHCHTGAFAAGLGICTVAVYIAVRMRGWR
jgi:hypothetical protein